MLSIIESNIDELIKICKENSVTELYLFGSATKNTFDNNSDLDFAVIFKESLQPLDHGNAFFSLLNALTQLLKRPVDLITYRSIKNTIFKTELDNTRVPIYVA